MSSSSPPDSTPTRDRIVVAAMELFGRQGYKATTVAQVEAAAGLSAGAGSLYRHFPSKRELLAEGLRRQAEAGASLTAFVEDGAALDGRPLRDQLLAVARAGLRRLEQERDVNRLLLRDLADHPDLLEAFRRHELMRVFDTVVAWLRHRCTDRQDVDVEAVAAVLVSAVSHYWVLTDIFTAHPMGIDEERYLGALADLAAATVGPA